MKKEFWQEKWNANEIGFHQDAPHPLLLKHFSALQIEADARVFVPFCGKSGDILCLQEMGFEVLGLELSELAVQSFFTENNLYASINDAGHYKRFQSAHIEILCGDFFTVKKDLLGNISAVFDRAALVALPPEMRSEYVKKMQSILPPQVEILLIALEYEQGSVNAPPFSVSQEEVDSLYGSWCDIELLERAGSEVKGEACHEVAYKIRLK